MFLMFDVGRGYISLQFHKNLKLNRVIKIEYQHKSNSGTKGYALFIHKDHKYAIYSMSEIRNNTKIIDLLQSKYFTQI